MRVAGVGVCVCLWAVPTQLCLALYDIKPSGRRAGPADVAAICVTAKSRWGAGVCGIWAHNFTIHNIVLNKYYCVVPVGIAHHSLESRWLPVCFATDAATLVDDDNNTPES